MAGILKTNRFRAPWLAGLLLLPLLVGCSTVKSWTNSSDDEEKPAVLAPLGDPFVEPDPPGAMPLTRRWDMSVSGAPEKYLVHPPVVEVSDKDIFVATQDGHVARVNADTGQQVWMVDVASAIRGGVAADETRVYVGTADAELVALERGSGSELWRVPLSSLASSAPVVAGSRVLIMTLDNRTYAFNSADGVRLWSHQTVPESLVVMGAPAPTVSRDAVFVGYSSGEVFGLNLADGKPVWRENLTVIGGRTELDLLQDVDGRIVIGDRLGYAVNHKGRLVAFDPARGQRIWEREVSSIRTPWWTPRRLFVSDMDGYVQAFNSQEGLPLWKTRVSDSLLTAPVVVGDHLYVADDKGRFAVLDPESGALVSMVRLGEPVLADPRPGPAGSLYLWTHEGDLMKFQ
ncbi:MAG: outer membrane protein assembly factor BamB [Magnetococcus sp. WYHC-3]